MEEKKLVKDFPSEKKEKKKSQKEKITTAILENGYLISFKARCDMEILDDVIEKFGVKVKIKKEDDDHFLLIADSTKQDIIHLSQRYLNFIEILEPVEIRSQIRENLEKSVRRYRRND